MKKAIFFIISIMLCLALFFCGCSENDTEVNKQSGSYGYSENDTKVNMQSEFCRVLCLKDDGIIVWIENIGNVYVKAVDTTLEIEPLDTVVMEFSESDLESVSGKFTDCFEEEQSYFYIIENPKSIRHTTEEEPTFG